MECYLCTIVITPLNSINKNQVSSLGKRGIPACYEDMNMSNGGDLYIERVERVGNRKYQMIMVLSVMCPLKMWEV